MVRRKAGLIVGLLLVALVFLNSPVPAKEQTPININTASAEELTTLEGIGQAYAARIVSERETNGPFKVPEDLMKVKGIGPKIFEKIKKRIVVE